MKFLEHIYIYIISGGICRQTYKIWSPWFFFSWFELDTDKETAWLISCVRMEAMSKVSVSYCHTLPEKLENKKGKEVPISK